MHFSTRLKAIRHYFSEDALAYFEPNNPKDLAGQMIRLYRDPELRVRLADRAKQEYEPIRWDVMKDRYLKVIESLTGQAHRNAKVLSGPDQAIHQDEAQVETSSRLAL